MRFLDAPPLGLGHFTVLEVPPLDLPALAAKIGYAAIGLRLHPAVPGGLTYAVPAGSQTSREMQRRLDGEGVTVYDIEFVVVGGDFVPASLSSILESASALGAQRLNICSADPDQSRFIANFAALCDLAAEFGMGVDLECMAWREISDIPMAVRAVEAAGRTNGGILVDALHLSRTGGTPAIIAGISTHLIRSAQLCDARADRPVGNDAIMLEARSQRLPPGTGSLPLSDLLAALPQNAVLSVEVPMEGAAHAEQRARAVFDATQWLFARCRAAGEVASERARNLPS